MSEMEEKEIDAQLFALGALLRTEDEQLYERARSIASGEGVPEQDGDGALARVPEETLRRLDTLASPLDEDFMEGLVAVAQNSREGTTTVAASSDTPRSEAQTVVSMSAWRSRGTWMGGGALSVAAVLALMWWADAGESDMHGWGASYGLELVTAPTSTRGDPDLDTPSTTLTVESDARLEWILRPATDVDLRPGFAARIGGESRPLEAPCVRHDVAPSGAIAVEMDLASCPWAATRAEVALQMVVGPEDWVMNPSSAGGGQRFDIALQIKNPGETP